VPDVVDDPAWLIATSGFCSNLNVVMKERDVGASETEGDATAHFIADIEFNYYPQSAVKFTDFPHHLAKTIEGDAAEADALVSSSWDHKNIALLEPTSTCSADEQSSQAWGISVFKVEEHRPCADGETAWEGHPCVHYSGYVSAATSNFVNVNEGRFVCQLFVDSVETRCELVRKTCENDGYAAWRPGGLDIKGCAEGFECDTAWALDPCECRLCDGTPLTRENSNQDQCEPWSLSACPTPPSDQMGKCYFPAKDSWNSYDFKCSCFEGKLKLKNDVFGYCYADNHCLSNKCCPDPDNHFDRNQCKPPGPWCHPLFRA